jgi:hypothetical protein
MQDHETINICITRGIFVSGSIFLGQSYAAGFRCGATGNHKLH